MQSAQKFSVIIVAAGTGTRFGNEIPKQYVELSGYSILQRTLEVFIHVEGIRDICVVINPLHNDLFVAATEGLENIILCSGGHERKDSVYNGLLGLSHLKEEDIVLVHDAARPFIKPSDIRDVLKAMKENKAVSLACPVVDTLRYSNEGGFASSTVERENLWAIQTPQAFHYGLLRRAHEECNSINYTDDSALVSELGVPVKFIKGTKVNFKITLAEDLQLAEQILSTEIHIGHGFDVHAFDDDENDVKSVRLCGVDIEYNRKLKGHSDSDVGLHALTDAIYGAISEGDIGMHFPPSNMDFKDMDSSVFLEHAMKLLRNKGGKLINADITLICESPKIMAYRRHIIDRLSEILDVLAARVNIKATTTEKLGFVGREEGIAAQATVSVLLPHLDEQI